jgi:hypothetical protein
MDIEKVQRRAVGFNAPQTTSSIFAESIDENCQPLALPTPAERALGLREKNATTNGPSWLSDLHVLGFEGVSRRLRCGNGRVAGNAGRWDFNASVRDKASAAAKAEAVAPLKRSAAAPLKSKLQPKQLKPKLLKPKSKQEKSGEQVPACNDIVAIRNEMEALRNEILAMRQGSDVSIVSTQFNGMELPTLLTAKQRSVTSLSDCETDTSLDDTVQHVESFKIAKFADDVAPNKVTSGYSKQLVYPC